MSCINDNCVIFFKKENVMDVMDKKNHFFLLFSLFLFVLSFSLLTNVYASEEPSPSARQQTYVHYETNLVLEKVVENIAIISGTKYIYTDQTSLIDHSRQKQGLMFRELSCPCLVNLVYKQYSLMTEMIPYAPGTRILEKLTIIEKIAPAMLDKYIDEDSRKVN